MCENETDQKTMYGGIPVDMRVVPCRFGCPVSAGRYSVPEGCVCFRDDTEQDLCAQHASSAEPLGEMKIIRIYDPAMIALLNGHKVVKFDPELPE
jgi:hypothetical protein